MLPGTLWRYSVIDKLAAGPLQYLLVDSSFLLRRPLASPSSYTHLLTSRFVAEYKQFVVKTLPEVAHLQL